MANHSVTQIFCCQFLYINLGLSHLCEFIEDCEHTVLATRILHLLGREGPRTQKPAKYIRFIYNRVILENAAVRAGLWKKLLLSLLCDYMKDNHKYLAQSNENAIQGWTKISS